MNAAVGMSRNGIAELFNRQGVPRAAGWEAMVCLDDPARHRLSRRRSVTAVSGDAFLGEGWIWRLARDGRNGL